MPHNKEEFTYQGMVLTPDAADVPEVIDIMSAGFSYLFDNPTSVFTTAKVRDLLFDGIELKCRGSFAVAAWAALCAGLRLAPLPPAIRFDQTTGNFYYSFFYHVSRIKL